MSTSQSRFASKTLFSALAVESGDKESEDEQLIDSVKETPIRTRTFGTTSKLSKTAQKKAAKAAREAKQKARLETQRKKHSLANGTTPTEPESESAALSTSADTAPEPETLPLPPPPEVQQTPLTQIPNATPSVPAPPQEDVPANELPKASVEVVTTPQIEEVVEVAEKAVEVTEVHSEDIPVAVKQEPATANTENVLPSNNEKKRQAILTRTLWTFMIGGFIGKGTSLIRASYIAKSQLYSLKSAPPSESGGKKAAKDPWSKTLNWYFFAVTNYFLYGESIIYYFKHVVFSGAQLLPFAANHRIISFTLHTIGFVGFVMSLKKGYLKHHFIVNNILEGLIWFWVPASLVICNDVFAYICGITLGRTPLIKLSPKKTVEGFVGAYWCTMLFSLAWGAYFMP
ncbi:phosphatidate cytidylyltransferase [Paramarasmius palmivorus]|uniref:phosphatidate cytidylyltransferase n=1 Tax=Paramarasmius palmivorus TaxID=297713 RepID=A0AAW0BC79_9AGAR